MAALRTNPPDDPAFDEIRKIRKLIEQAFGLRPVRLLKAAEEQARTSAAMWRARDRPKRSR